MALKYINIFKAKALQKFAQSGIFGLKINHLATLTLRKNKCPGSVVEWYHLMVV
jgi:hypothetical protein